MLFTLLSLLPLALGGPVPSPVPSMAVVVAPPPQKLAWASQDALDSPSSAYYEPEGRYVYVANLGGYLTRMTPTGKVTNSRWIDGLHAPRGIRAHGARLWVADTDSLVEIDIPSAKILRKVRVPGARQLTDIAIGPDASLYVSDLLAGAITRVTFTPIGSPAPGSGTTAPSTAPAFSTLLAGSDAEGPTGLLVDGAYLVVAAWGVPAADLSTPTPGHLYRIELATGKKTLLTRNPIGNLSGIEKDPVSGFYWVSDWVKGIIYLISEHGSVTPAYSGFRNPGDIGLAADRSLLFVPQTGANQVDALDTQRK